MDGSASIFELTQPVTFPPLNMDQRIDYRCDTTFEKKIRKKNLRIGPTLFAFYRVRFDREVPNIESGLFYY